MANPAAMTLKIIRLNFSYIAFFLLVPSILESHDKRLVSSASYPIFYTIALSLHMSISSSVTQRGILQALWNVIQFSLFIPDRKNLYGSDRKIPV